MPYLMHITFDNSRRLPGHIYYFEYAGVRFKLIQNEARKWSDVLLTIIPENDSSAEQRAYSAAGEFLSALSWENSARIALRHEGGMGVGACFRLRRAKCRVFRFPEVPFSGHATGYTISTIPATETDDQRIALTLFREGHSSNKLLLSFLFYWQIMEIRTNDPVGWINKTYYRRVAGFYFNTDDVQQLPLRGRKLGEYLQEDCRHAIAHIRRKPGKRPLKFDVGEEDRRLAISTRIIQELAKHYITNVLGLRNKLYLVRKGGLGFPVYVTKAFLQRAHCVPAYH